MSEPGGSIDLYWIPLGAGAHVVRICGRIFEALAAFASRRPRCDLYHSALVVHVPEGRFVIEQAPVPKGDGAARGVVAQGSVGTRCAGRFRIFRYEVRRWRDGQIPDVRAAVGDPLRVSRSLACARRVLDVLAEMPTPVWGRDELHTGEMWNSNSVVSWALARGGVGTATINPPQRGRAPGWHAGIVMAHRSEAAEPRIREDEVGSRNGAPRHG
jgi:hypothetical protein